MTNTATKEQLEQLHSIVITSLTEIITKGVPLIKGGEAVLDEEGQPVYVPAAPAYYAQAVKALSDNDITAVLTPGSPLQGLIEGLPTFMDEEGELPTVGKAGNA